jgi:hypothetical protein
VVDIFVSSMEGVRQTRWMGDQHILQFLSPGTHKLATWR